MYMLLCSSSLEGGNRSLSGSGCIWLKSSKAETDYFFLGSDSKLLPEQTWDAQVGEAIYLWPISYNKWSREQGVNTWLGAQKNMVKETFG